MGIQNFNKLLREKCPNVFVPYPVTDFTGKRIAIDGHNWIFINLSIAHKKNVNATDVATQDPDRNVTIKYWLSAALDFISTWIAYGITPVFVFDGEHPMEKNAEKQKRYEKREEAIQKLKDMRENVNKMEMLARDAKVVDELRKLMCQTVYPSKDEISILVNLLEGIGIPCLKANGDAEQLCSHLCIEGKVSAVFSTDTDNFVHGCPMVITEFTTPLYNSKTGEKVHQVMTVSIKSILEGLEIKFSTLVDLCILAGCDYNDTIKSLGITRAYDLMKKYESIDLIPRLSTDPNKIDHNACKCRLPNTNKGKPIDYDIKILNHERCRELFKYRESGISSEQLNINKNVLYETGRDFLNSMELNRYLTRLVQLYKNLPEPQKENIIRPPTQIKMVVLN